MVLTQEEAEEQIRKEKSVAPTGSGLASLSEEGIKRKASFRVKKSRSKKGKSRVIGPTSPERAAKLKEVEKRNVSNEIEKSIARGEIVVNKFGQLEAKNDAARKLIDVGKTTGAIGPVDVTKQPITPTTQEEVDIRRQRFLNSLREDFSKTLERPLPITLRRINKVDTKAAPRRVAPVLTEEQQEVIKIPTFQETIPKKEDISKETFDKIIGRNAKPVLSEVRATTLPLSAHVEKDFGTAGLFTLGFVKGSENVIVETVKTGGFNLVEGTAQLIAKPGETMEDVSVRIQSGPISAGEVTGEIVTSSLIGKFITKGVLKGGKTFKNIRHIQKTRIPPERLGPDFEGLTRLADNPSQTQLIPKDVSSAEVIDQWRKTFLKKQTPPPGGNLDFQTRLESKTIENVVLESGFIESRVIPKSAGVVRLNILRGELFKQAQKAPKPKQLELPLGTSKDFSVTILEPRTNTFIRASKFGVFGKRGQLRVNFFEEPELIPVETNLQKPKSIFEPRPLIKPTGPQAFRNVGLEDLITPKTSPEREIQTPDIRYNYKSAEKIDQGMKLLSDVEPAITPDTINLEIQEIRSISRQKPKVDQDERLEEDVREKQSSDKALMLDLSLSQQEIVTTIPDKLIDDEIIPPPDSSLIKKIPKSFFSSKNDEDLKFRDDEFSVFLRRKGHFSPLKTSVSLGEALRIGSLVVRESSAASFKVLNKLGRPVSVSLADPALKGQFRRSKKERGVLIEEEKYRINKPGELREITFKGLSAIKFKSGLL